MPRKSTGSWQSYTDDVIAAKRLRNEKQQSQEKKPPKKPSNLARQPSGDVKSNLKTTEESGVKPDKKRGLFYKGKNIWKKISK